MNAPIKSQIKSANTTPSAGIKLLGLEIGLVLAGGFAGALVRVGVSLLILPFDHGFPWDILFINISGSFLLGALAGYRDINSRKHELLWLTVGVGFIGAYTTFSSYALGVVNLALAGKASLSALYLAGSMLAGILTVEAGLFFGAQFLKKAAAVK